MKVSKCFFPLALVVILIFISCSDGSNSPSGGVESGIVTVKSVDSSNETFITFDGYKAEFYLNDSNDNLVAVLSLGIDTGSFNGDLIEWDNENNQPTGNTFVASGGETYTLSGHIDFTEPTNHTPDSGEPELRSTIEITIDGDESISFYPNDFEVTSVVVLLENANENIDMPFKLSVFENGDDPETTNPIAVMNKTIDNNGEVAGHVHAADTNGDDTGDYVYATPGHYDIYAWIDVNDNNNKDSGDRILELTTDNSDTYIDNSSKETTRTLDEDVFTTL